MKLPQRFYLQKDVVQVARQLLGKILCTNSDGIFCSGIITETEAYNGIVDKASHAFGGRRTKRTEIMYAEGGIAYVYLIYGIRSLFNVVTNNRDIPHAVLVRAIRPLEGIDIMEQRRGMKADYRGFTSGPGSLSQALGIHYSHTGKSLSGDEIWIEDRKINIHEHQITAGPRIGVAYAGEDAMLPYRFLINTPVVTRLK